MARNALRQVLADGGRLVTALHAIAAPQAEQNNWNAMKSLLTIGSRLEGIRLTGAECRLLLQVLNGERRRPLRRGRRRAPEIDIRDYKIALYSLLLELDGEPTEAAVKASEQFFSVSRSTVFTASQALIGLGGGASRRSGGASVTDRGVQIESNEIGELTRPLFW